MKFKKVKIFAIILAVYSFLGFVALPYLVQSNFSKLIDQNLNTKATLAKVYLNPFTFELELDDLLVHDDKNKTLLYFKNLYVDLEFTSLLKGEIIIRDIKIDSLKTSIAMYRDKRFNFSHILDYLGPSPKTKAKKDDESTTPVVFKLDRFLAKDTRVVYSDDTRSEKFEFRTLPFDIVLNDFSTLSEKKAYFKTDIEIIELLRLNLESNLLLSPLKLDGKTSIKDIKLLSFYQYLSEDLDFKFDGHIDNISTNFDIDLEDKLKAKLDDLRFNLKRIDYSDKTYGSNLSSLDTTISKIDISKDKNLVVDLDGKLNIKKIDAYSLKDGNSSFDFDGDVEDIKTNFELTLKDENLSVDVTKTALFLPLLRYGDDNFDVAIKDTNTSIDDLKLLKDNNISYVVNAIILKNKNIKVKHHKKDKKKNFIFKDLNIAVDSFSSDKNNTSNIVLNIFTPKKGKIDLATNLKLEPLLVKNNLKIKDLTITPYKSYVKDFVNIDIKSTTIDSDLDIDITKDTQSAKGDIEISKIDLHHSKKKKQVLKLNRFDIGAIEYKNDQLYIGDVLLDDLYTTFKIDKNKKTNFDDLVVKKDSKKDTNETKKEDNTTKKVFHYHVKNFKLQKGLVEFSDHSLPLDFDTNIHDISADIKDISSKDKEASINLSAVIEKYGLTNIDIKTKPSNFKEKTEALVTVENIDLRSFTPYSGKFVGKKIKDGKLNLDLDYYISDSDLTSTNRIRLKNMSFGDEVNSSDAVNLPLGLAIALLEDSKGLIDVNIPIKGDIDNPQFELGSVIWKAVGNMITNIVTAPFRFLGSLLGLDSEELGNIEFKFASSKLLPPQKEKLDKLIGVLKDKKHLSLAIPSIYDKQNDRDKIIELRYKDMIKGENKQETIKKVYISIFGKENLAKITKKYKKEEVLAVLSKNIKDTITVSQSDLQSLAKQRANNLKSYFVSKGLDANRVTIKEKIDEIKQNTTKQVTIKLELKAKGN